MFASPDTLENLCLEIICENVSTYIEPVIENSDSWQEVYDSDDNSFMICEYNSSVNNSSLKDKIKKFRFKDPDIFLINRISEKLLEKFCEKRILRDALLNIFLGRNTKLQKFKVKNCKLTKSGLQILKEHKITDLECINLKKCSIPEVIGKIYLSFEHTRSI